MYRLMSKMGYKAELIQYRKRIEEEPVNHDLGKAYANTLYEFFGDYIGAEMIFGEKNLDLIFLLENILKFPHFVMIRKV